MAAWTEDDYRLEQVYSDALECIATGLTKAETLEELGDAYGTKVTVAAIEAQALQAAKDAPRNGIDREDVDGSWGL